LQRNLTLTLYYSMIRVLNVKHYHTVKNNIFRSSIKNDLFLACKNRLHLLALEAKTVSCSFGDIRWQQIEPLLLACINRHHHYHTVVADLFQPIYLTFRLSPAVMSENASLRCGPQLRPTQKFWRDAHRDRRRSACIYTRYDASGDSNCSPTRPRMRLR